MKTITKRYRVKEIKNSNKTIVKYYDGITKHLNGFPKWRIRIMDGVEELTRMTQKLNGDGYIRLE